MLRGAACGSPALEDPRGLEQDSSWVWYQGSLVRTGTVPVVGAAFDVGFPLGYRSSPEAKSSRWPAPTLLMQAATPA